MVTFVHASLVRTSHLLPPTMEDQGIQSYHGLWSQRDGNTWWIILMRAVEELAMETQMGRGAVDIPDLLCSCIPELQACGWCSLKIITSWTGSWKIWGEGRLHMNWTEHELCVRLCWMLEIQDGHSTYPKGVNNHLRNSKVWNSIRIWNPRSKVESDQPRREGVAWSVAVLGGCCIHSCCLKVGAAHMKSEVSAIACFLVSASTFTHSPQIFEGAVTGAIPGGEPRTHSKVFEVYEYCLSNVLLRMGMFHLITFLQIFSWWLCAILVLSS